MYRRPSRRKKDTEVKKPNLIPILDAVFIFIFFLLMSANFIKIYEISSDVPILSTSTPPKQKKKPLALTLKVTSSGITVYTGVPSSARRKFRKTADGSYDLEGLHNYLIDIKKRNKNEKTAILEPLINITYEEIVKIMDSIRVLKKTDPAIFVKEKDGTDKKLELLFNNIVFGNIQS